MKQAVRRTRILIFAVLLGIGPAKTDGQPPQAPTLPTDLRDARLAELRRAAASWDERLGPEREVVDQVCLVPDVPTFLAALSTWDRSHWFPILIDDVETNARFLRAFRPERIVRFPARAEPVPADQLWQRALEAVSRAWSLEGERPSADRPPLAVGPTPPGVVVTSPGSPSLAGAVALAAGRFQPLVRWEPAQRYANTIEQKEAEELAADLRERIGRIAPNYARLGDACDFLTIGADVPYRYKTAEGPMAFDDLLGRGEPDNRRWAYAGRLIGDAPASVYQAMCSLFLRVESASLFNTYSEKEQPWSTFEMRSAASRLARYMPVTHSASPSNKLGDWHEVFAPSNRFGLVLINTSGGPRDFNIGDGPGRPADVSPGVPSAVVQIHSFSAADPTDPDTLAGRWLANGAFAYFGSMHEPYLIAFRTPSLVSEAMAAGLPLVAAVRQSALEPFGRPWRLVYLGDPLFRVRSRRGFTPRLNRWNPTDSWPTYQTPKPPGADADAIEILGWALRTALMSWKLGRDNPVFDRVGQSLGQIDRSRLDPEFRAVLDGLVADVWYRAGRLDAFRGWIARSPNGLDSPTLRRYAESTLVIEFERAASRGEFADARKAFEESLRMTIMGDVKRRMASRLTSMASTATRLSDWRNRLRVLRDRMGKTPDGQLLEDELAKVEKRLAALPKR